LVSLTKLLDDGESLWTNCHWIIFFFDLFLDILDIDHREVSLTKVDGLVTFLLLFICMEQPLATDMVPAHDSELNDVERLWVFPLHPDILTRLIAMRQLNLAIDDR